MNGNKTNSKNIETIVYYAETLLNNSLISFCKSILISNPGDPVIMFWKAFGLLLQEKYTDANKEFGQLLNKRDLSIAAPCALIYSYESLVHAGYNMFINLRF